MKVRDLVEDLMRLDLNREVFLEKPSRNGDKDLVEPEVKETQSSDPATPSVFVVIR